MFENRKLLTEFGLRALREALKDKDQAPVPLSRPPAPTRPGPDTSTMDMYSDYLGKQNRGMDVVTGDGNTIPVPGPRPYPSKSRNIVPYQPPK